MGKCNEGQQHEEGGQRSSKEEDTLKQLMSQRRAMREAGEVRTSNGVTLKQINQEIIHQMNYQTHH